MNVGMLWLDDDKRTTFEEKIGQAADFYQEKFGVAPDMCLVNVGMLKAELQVGSIHVCPVRNVLPNHFWIGNDQAKRPS
jgi:hypothetical protein